MANTGVIDGDLLRVPQINFIYKNLIRVEQASMNFNFVAFRKNRNIKVHSKHSFSNYNAAVVRGWKILEEQISNSKKITLVTTPKNLFRLLEKGRTDVILFEQYEGLCLIRDLGINTIYMQNKVLITKKMHLFLHKKHAKLAHRLANKIAEIKREDLYSDVILDCEKDN